MKKVLFLGASGRVGETASRFLLEHYAEAELTLVTRSSVPDMQRFGDSVSRVRHINADIFAAGILSELVKGQDLVVSCVGPSCRVGTAVIDACISEKVPLLDVSGYDPALKYLDSLGRTGDIPSPVVVNSGLLPGLSGSYPLYMISKYRKDSEVTNVEVFYAGRDTWSFNSAMDIVVSLGGFGDNKGFCRIEDGRVKKIGFFKSLVKVKFPEMPETLSGLSMYSEEMMRLINAENIKNATVSGANIGKKAGLSLMWSMLLKRYRSEKGILKGAASLVKAAKKDALTADPFFGIYCRLTMSDGKTATGYLTAGDTYALTGMVMGINALYMLSHGVKPGGYSMHEAIPCNYIIDYFLNNQAVRIRESVNSD